MSRDVILRDFNLLLDKIEEFSKTENGIFFKQIFQRTECLSEDDLKKITEILLKDCFVEDNLSIYVYGYLVSKGYDV